MTPRFLVVFTIMATGIPLGGIAQGRQSSSLRAGAAKVDVTPAAGELPKNYDGILDHRDDEPNRQACWAPEDVTLVPRRPHPRPPSAREIRPEIIGC